MTMKNIFYGLILLATVTSCGVPQKDYDELSQENQLLKANLSQSKAKIDKLQTEVDELHNGAERISAIIDKSYADKDYVLARQNIRKLNEKHPEFPKYEKYKELLKTIDKEEQAERVRKEAEEKERIRLANLNNTGMWSINHYVDEFGEFTDGGYITNTKVIKGTFSNTATQDSDLNVRFLISSSSDISIKLFEYAGDNPVKAFSDDYYKVLVQDNDGNRIKLTAVNYSDRFSLGKSESKKLHTSLMKGGKLKFLIYDNDNSTTQYQFTIYNANWYENAYKKLTTS